MSPRLCMIVHGSFPIGEARVTREASAAIDAGWDVDAIALRRPGEPATAVVDGVRVFRVPITHVRGGSFPRMVSEYFGFTSLAAAVVARRFLTDRYDVVQAHNPPDFLVAAAAVPRLFGARTVLDVHDLAPDMFAMRMDGRRGARVGVRALRAIETAAFRAVDAVITVHEQYRREIIARGAHPAKTHVVMNSLDERLLPGVSGASSTDIRIVHHGTITPHYAVHALVDAFATLPRSTMARLEIYGEGDGVTRVHDAIRRNHVEDRVTLVDRYLPQREVLARVKGARIGVIANLPIPRNELVLPAKLLEYVALGIPAVAADLSTIRAHFDHREVLYFKAGDTRSLAAALRATLDDPDAAARRAAAARRRYDDQYRWGVQSERYLALLDDLATGRPRPSRSAR